MNDVFLFFIVQGGLGAERPQNTAPEAPFGAWYQAPCLLFAIFDLFVHNLTSLPLQTQTRRGTQPGWLRDVQLTRSHELLCNSAHSFQGDSHG
jgi:hypothetical protein